MEPRLKSSVKWSPFPQDLNESAALVLKERFAEEYDLKDAEFCVEGRIYSEEIVGRYGLRSKKTTRQQNFEISFEYNSKKDKALELIHSSMDIVEHLWLELFEDDLDDSELLKTWQTMPFEKKMYYFRFSTINSQLEEEADKLLAEFEKKLVYEGDEELTPESGFDSVEDGSPEDTIETDEDSIYDEVNSTESDSSKKTIH